METNKKVCILTLGCKVNQYESSSIIKALQDNGFYTTDKLSFADYYILNSCAVTNEAEHKSREYVAKIIKINNNAKIYVCGCSSQIHPNDYKSKTNVVGVIGTENKMQIVDLILKDKKICEVVEPSTVYNDNYCALKTKTRAYIKIQDGCNNFCSYCIIPYTRGRERSRELESIKKDLCILTQTTPEIVITGINIASYGKDLKNNPTLIDVVKLFTEYPNTRFRFSSWEMGTISEDLLKELKKHTNFCPYFHISLQSANDEVLKKMNRHYNFKEYKNIIDLILKYFPNAGIGTDIIVGFPTETDLQFDDCLKNLSTIKFLNVHGFPYSKRDGTVAGNLKQINGTIIKSRTIKLKELTTKLKETYLKSQIGKYESVLVEQNKNGYFTGFSKNYIKTYIKNNNIELEKSYNVKFVDIYNDGLLAEIKNN